MDLKDLKNQRLAALLQRKGMQLEKLPSHDECAWELWAPPGKRLAPGLHSVVCRTLKEVETEAGTWSVEDCDDPECDCKEEG